MERPLHAATAELKAVTRGLWSDGRGWILLAVSAGWALSIGVRFVYPALVPFVQSEFRIDLATTGLLLTMLWGAYAVGHVPGGILGDRLGEGNVLVLSTALSTATVLAIATSVNVWMLFAATITFGLATALYGPTRFTILTDIYSERSGSAIGLTMSAGSVGNAVFPVAAAFVAASLTWRYGFGAFVPLFAMVVVALWVAVPGRTSESGVDAPSWEVLGRLKRGITRGSIPTVVSIQVSISFILQGFSSFYPTYLTATKGTTPEVAALLFGSFFAVGALIQPLAGNLMDRVGVRWTLVTSLGGGVVALWLLPFLHGLLPLVAVTVLLSSLTGCIVVTQTHIADALPSDIQGTGLGTLKAGWMTLGATSPLLVGVLAEYGRFDEGFLLLAVVGSAGLLLSVVGTRSR